MSWKSRQEGVLALQKIQVREGGGAKKRPHICWGVWIFSGITHFLTIMTFTIWFDLGLITVEYFVGL